MVELGVISFPGVSFDPLCQPNIVPETSFLGKWSLLKNRQSKNWAQKDGVIGCNEIGILWVFTPTEAQYSYLGSKFLERKLKASRGVAMIYSS